MDLIQSNWSEETPYCIYKHTSPSGKVYIGKTCRENLQKRFLHEGIGYRECSYFWKAIQKYGWDNIKHEILIEGLTKIQADEYEKMFIKEYKKLKISYNLTEGGDGSSGTSFNSGRILIYKDNEIKRINKELLEEYFLLGWSRGYPQSVKNKISETHKVRPNKNTLGKKSIYKGDLMKKVNPSELSEYLNNGWELGIPPNLKNKIKNAVDSTISKKGKTVWIHNENECRLIQQNDLSSYLNCGWYRGMGKQTNSTKGYKWMHKNGERIRVSSNKINEYINNGWELGQK